MPLNPGLFNRLETLFGRVIIVNEGDEGAASIVRRAGGGAKLDIRSFGESYRVSCPFCSDTRRRLWINYRYGQPDPAGGSFRLDALCICFNERCVPDNAHDRRRLAEQILGFQNRNSRTQTWHVRRGRRSPGQPHQVLPAGGLIGLSSLPEMHSANVYLRERGFDLGTANHYGLTYCICANPQFLPAQGRIICPIDFRGTRVGWQGRYIGKPPNNNIPKYYTSPGMAKSRILYNFDRATHQPFLVVTEGITDVWRLGDVAVAALGHDLSTEQRNLLRQYSGGVRPVFMMLDGEEQERNRQYVAELHALGIPAAAIELPDSLDPADCSRAELMNIINQQACSAGFQLASPSVT